MLILKLDKALSTKILIWLTIIWLLIAIAIVRPPVQAADFTVQTGYYVGSGASGLAISGVGFQPDYVMIKSTTTAGVAVFKTSAMPANTTAFTSATADDTGTNITLNSDGFTLGTLANVNSANVIYHWIAIGGSDCSATGNFCVGTYTGNGTSPRNITVGFQPEMAIVKRSTNIRGQFRVASQAANRTLFFDGTTEDATGTYISAFGATTFQVGATDNVNLATYYYAAFSTTAGSFAEGTYTGNNTDNRSITGLGFKPDFVMIQNPGGNNVANRQAVMNFNESYGDSTSHVGATTANITDAIQLLESTGFQIGVHGTVNQNADTIYWFAIGGAASYSSSGSFSMATGSYTGTGSSNPRTGLGFRPELVVIKSNGASAGVFRTSLMHGDSTAHTATATANFTGGITSLDNDGFTVGTAAQTNTNGTVYQWQAFAGAYDPYNNDGSSDFAIGAYYGNVTDSRDITRLPWQPDMVTIKRNGASVGVWRPSSQTGDNTSFFNAAAQAADHIQAFNSDGFEIGQIAAINTDASVNYWFAFKEGSNFAVGSYTGSGTAQSITDAGLRAENVWIKRTTAVNAVQRSVSLSGDNTQYFAATANAADRITAFVKGGFRVGGSQTETNTNAGSYYYAAWNDSDFGTLSLDIVDANGTSVVSPSFAMNALNYSFDCRNIDGTLGQSTQKIRISNLTTTAGWSASIAPTSGSGTVWSNVGDTESYDFNDPTGTPNGCSDGADSDSDAGLLSVDASGGTLAPETGCTNTNVGLGVLAEFEEGITDAVEIASASSGANADCIWDVTLIDLVQTLPSEQPIGNYDINLTITIVAN